MTVTDWWFPLRHHPLQSKLWRTRKRFVAVAAGRGSGKTEIARRRIVRMLAVKKPWPDPVYFYALPTVNQAKRVAWNKIIRLIPRHWLAGDPNRSEMRIDTIFGSTLYVVGMDKPQRIEGDQYDGCVVDESSDQKPGSFQLTIRPALTHRQGWCWRIGVPKRFGIGADDFKLFYDQGLSGDLPDTESYTWSSEDILTPEEIVAAKMSMDDRDYNEQFRAHWERSSGAIFHAYDEIKNATNWVYDPKRPLLVGSDFNVNPMCWVIGQLSDDAKKLYIFDELFIRDTNTRQTLDVLFGKYGDHKTGWQFYGDASAKARKTSASETDYIQIKNDTRFVNAGVFYPPSNPAVVDRFAACNAMFCNALGERRLFVHPRCKKLIADLKKRSWTPGAMVPDDYGDIGHISDGLGYIVHRRFPLTFTVSSSPKVILNG